MKCCKKRNVVVVHNSSLRFAPASQTQSLHCQLHNMITNQRCGYSYSIVGVATLSDRMALAHVISCWLSVLGQMSCSFSPFLDYPEVRSCSRDTETRPMLYSVCGFNMCFVWYGKSALRLWIHEYKNVLVKLDMTHSCCVDWEKYIINVPDFLWALHKKVQLVFFKCFA